jgi:hypothetical protein
MEQPERPDAGGGFEPPAGSSGGQWLPPVPPAAPGAEPEAKPEWRISPRAVDLDPDAPPGPEPWADPGNSVAAAALGLSVAAFGILFAGYTLAFLSLPLAIAGTVLSWIGRGRIKRGETRQGKVEVGVGLAVGVATLLIAAGVIAAYVATH